METIAFSFDPRCPWCYQTSRWALRLQALETIKLKWSPFSLELRNFEGKSEEFDPATSKSAAALRTSVLVRNTEGEDACGRFYAALGRRYFYDLEDLTQRVTIESALEDADVSSCIYEAAMADAGTWSTVVAEHENLVDQVGGFGVPTIRLDGGAGPGMFGPVIKEVPPDDEALALLEHVVWLMRNPQFYELKRGRSEYPDLPHINKALAQRAARSSS